jgi:hypothetical protein
MSNSEKVEADSTATEEVKETEVKTKVVGSPAAANGDSSNGLSAQLEEKIIRQVEVRPVSVEPRGLDHQDCLCFVLYSSILGTGIYPETNFSKRQHQRMTGDVSS